MSYTDKILAEFVREFCNDHNGEIRFLRGVFYDEKDGAEQIIAFLTSKIAQALAEEGERIERKIKQAWNYPCNCDRKNILCIHDFSQMKVALSSLDINNKEE